MMKIKKIFLGLIVLMFCVSGTLAYAEIPIPGATSTTSSSRVEKTQTKDFDAPKIIEIGDRVEVRVYPEDEYIKGVEMQIGSEGNVILPLIGKVSVVGMSIPAAQEKLVKIIDADYLVNPEVILEIIREDEETLKKFLNVSVLGAIRSPSNYSIEIKDDSKNITLIQAVLKAGGFSDVANIKKIKIIRKGGGSNQVIKANAEAIISGKDIDIDLAEGDIIHVAESLF